MSDYMLAMLRRDKESSLDAECVISQPGSGDGTIDAAGVWSPAAGSQRWAGGCRARPAQGQLGSRTVDFAGQQLTLHLYEVQVPWAAEAAKDDVIKFTKSRDHLLEDAEMVVREVTLDEWGVTRILVCEGTVS